MQCAASLTSVGNSNRSPTRIAMSDSSEDWRAMKQRGKEHRKNKEFDAVYNLAGYCRENRVTLDFIQDWHLRLTKGNLCIDIYPQRNKYHILSSFKKKKRGHYKHLLDFVSYFFAE